ncbi:DUF58 domain-containing protein [Streptomonospora nanhaiensis]|uniref:Uncharacterized protein (DUF58 family) n=2 Tax=Streptomonospora nanhaiensis TaxID=1323731 RepID=A0A853BPJ8_9ACTN|nr:DUF58 domain-containing protein [Streptomonospora nanhaiensis]MBV2365741.1 DUF58 domain-containing protein [Streptomonospora nanhaiensis]NYI96537.1 uncharacterized protein (DUF58 family) [Streptomonospora nanhaiensis]
MAGDARPDSPGAAGAAPAASGASPWAPEGGPAPASAPAPEPAPSAPEPRAATGSASAAGLPGPAVSGPAQRPTPAAGTRAAASDTAADDPAEGTREDGRRGGAARPTPRGWFVLAGGAALLGAGVAFGYRELVVLGSVPFAVVLLSVVLVGRLRPMTVWRSVATPRVSPGDEVEVLLGTTEDGRGRGAHLLTDRVTGPTGTRTVELPARRSSETGPVGYRLRAERRGVLDLGPLESRRSDPLGLIATRRTSGRTERVWVHPRFEPLPSMPVGRTDDPQGVFDGGRAGSVSFHSLRDYVPGDDVRHIHWRSSARHNKLLVREHLDTSHTRLSVVADDRGGAAGDELAALDEVAGAAAAVVAASVNGRWACELRLVSGRSLESTGRMAPMLDLLAEARVNRDADFTEELWRLRNRPFGDTLVLVSASITSGEARLFSRLREVYPRLVLIVLRRFGQPLGAIPGVTVVNAADAHDLATRWESERWSA